MAKLPGSRLLDIIDEASIQSGEQIEHLLNDIRQHRIEDCAVVKNDETEWLFSTDFGPLAGKDPEVAGRIAALNALSDIYVKGGAPLYALVILCLENEMSDAEAAKILTGVYRTCREEGVQISGGHTIMGKETIVGMSVLGKVAEEKIFTKQGVKAGDQIWISKPIGTGIALRGYYHHLLGEEDYTEAIDTMLQSNAKAAQKAAKAVIHAMTDVTGFGLIGHLTEMLQDGQGARIYTDQVPMLNALKKLNPVIMKNNYMRNNMIYASEKCEITLSDHTIVSDALFDPQTNGPVMAVAAKECGILKNSGFCCIGEITESSDNQIVIS